MQERFREKAILLSEGQRKISARFMEPCLNQSAVSAEQHLPLPHCLGSSHHQLHRWQKTQMMNDGSKICSECCTVEAMLYSFSKHNMY